MQLVLCPSIPEALHLFGPSLEPELRARGSADTTLRSRKVHVAICGVGLAAAGAGASFHLSRLVSEKLSLAFLVGIAGTLDSKRAPVTTAVVADKVRAVGIGVGAGDEHLPVERIGFPHGYPLIEPHEDGWLKLLVPAATGGVVGSLLSVASAAGRFAEAETRASCHPDAVAEDMETFSVALAATMHGVGLTVVRGISDVSGERDTTKWKIQEALASVRDVLEQLVAREP